MCFLIKYLSKCPDSMKPPLPWNISFCAPENDAFGLLVSDPYSHFIPSEIKKYTWFSGVFRSFAMGQFVRNGLTKYYFQIWSFKLNIKLVKVKLWIIIRKPLDHSYVCLYGSKELNHHSVHCCFLIEQDKKR